MLLGQSPFRGDDEDEIFDAILEDEPLYPITMPKDAVSILQKVWLTLLTFDIVMTSHQLLTRDPTRRLGSGKGDAEEIKRHPFFKDVNWDDVVNKRIPPPYFPQIVRILLFHRTQSTPTLIFASRKRPATSVTSTKNSRESNPLSLLCTGNSLRRIKWNSMDSLGCVLVLCARFPTTDYYTQRLRHGPMIKRMLPRDEQPCSV